MPFIAVLLSQIMEKRTDMASSRGTNSHLDVIEGIDVTISNFTEVLKHCWKSEIFDKSVLIYT
jgi:hypothetical protein